jgi:hypothetical protein
LYKNYLSYIFLPGFLAKAFLKEGFCGLGIDKAAFLAFKITAFGFFEGVLRAKRLAV